MIRAGSVRAESAMNITEIAILLTRERALGVEKFEFQIGAKQLEIGGKTSINCQPSSTLVSFSNQRLFKSLDGTILPRAIVNLFHCFIFDSTHPSVRKKITFAAPEVIDLLSLLSMQT